MKNTKQKKDILIFVAFVLGAVIFMAIWLSCAYLQDAKSLEIENENQSLKTENEELEKRIDELEIENERLQTLTDSVKEDVVRVVMAESRGESLEGQMAVAQTILDRSVEWNKPVSEIISAPNQYAAPYEGEISDLSVEAVERIFLHGERVFDAPTLYFHANYMRPWWADIYPVRGDIGVHIFYGGNENV